MLKPFILTFLAAAGALSAADYFPLQNGNSWTYRAAGGTAQFTIRVGTPALVDGEIWYSLSGYVPQRLLVRYEGDRLLYLDDQDGQPRQLTSFQPGASWKAPLRQCAETGEAQSKPAAYSGPTGPIDNALEIRYTTSTCADAGDLSELYADHLGMLRRTVQSFAGPVNYELVSARLVSAAIETLPNGRFTVSAAPAAGELAVTLRLQLSPAPPITLTFPTSQQYDLVVRDDTGKVVYQWSDGRFFSQSEHSISVSSEWNTEFRVPAPGPGVYTVQAWLATDTRVPLFAATAPLVIEAANAPHGRRLPPGR